MTSSEQLIMRAKYQNEHFELACLRAASARFTWRGAASVTLFASLGLAFAPGAWTIASVIVAAFIAWRSAHRASRAIDEAQQWALALTHTRMMLRQQQIYFECYSDRIRIEPK